MNIRMVSVLSSQQVDTLAALASKIWHEHYTPLLGVEQVDYMVEKFQSPAALTQQLSQGYLYYLMEADGVPAGFIGIHPEDTSLFLSKLYVDKPFRRQHLAARGVEFLKAYCREHGLSSIWLTVNRGNSGSIAAYEKLGFIKTREEKADIGNGFFMDDYIMELTVPAQA